MSGSISWEATLFFRAFQLGMLLMMTYDCLKVLRIILPHHRIVISIEDFCYWVFNGIMVFLLLYQENDGTIRGFALVALFLGMLLYNFTISRWFISGVKKIIQLLKKVMKSFTISFKKR